MVSAIENRVNRLEQSHPHLTGSPEIVIEKYFLDPAYPEMGSFENHYQHGIKIYDGLDELLATVNGKTRSI
jgi:hypothetical protein